MSTAHRQHAWKKKEKLKVMLGYEPSRLSQECLIAAYEQVLKQMGRDPSAQRHQSQPDTTTASKAAPQYRRQRS